MQRRHAGFWSVVALLATSQWASAQPQVRIVYLVPTDRVANATYVSTLQNAAQHLQVWYRDQMGNGKTFRLHDPIVEVVNASHDAAWYSTNPVKGFDLWFWNNVLSDAFALTGGMFDDPNNRWIYYIDADPDCGQLGGGGTSGVAVLPANDFRGLAGEANIPPCSGEAPDNAGVCRWVGGLGHELGHAFDLPHPPECEDADPNTVCPSDALMWLGFRSYPTAQLLPEDITFLNGLPFFALHDPVTPLFDCSCLTQCPSARTLFLDSNGVTGGHDVPARIILDQPADDTGVEVTLTSSHPDIASVPSTILIRNMVTGFFTITTEQVTKLTNVTIVATAGGVAKTVLRVKSLVVWDGGGDGTRWLDALNWNIDIVPEALDDVVIDLPGDYTVIIDGPAVAGTIELGAGLGSQVVELQGGHTLAVGGAVDVAAGGSLNVHGTMSIGGSLDIADGSLVVINPLEPEHAGLVQVNGDVSNSGVLRLTSDADQDAILEVVCPNVFRNTATGTVELLPGAGGLRTIRGDVSNAGTFQFSASSLMDGVFDHLAGAVMNAWPLFWLTPMDIQFSKGLVNQGMINVGGGGVERDVTLSVTGGALVNGVGGLITIANGMGGARALNADVTNSGTMTFNVSAHVGGSLTNNAAGLIEVARLDDCCDAAPEIAGALVNNGMLRITSSVSGDSGLAVTGGAVTNNPGGTIELLLGAGGTRILDADLSNDGNFNIFAPANLLKPLQLNSGTLNLDSGFPVTVSEFTQTGGTLTGSSDLIVVDMTSWSGGTMDGSGKTICQGGLMINGASNEIDGTRVVENHAAAGWTAGRIAMGSDSQLINMPAGVFEIRSDADLDRNLPAVPIFKNLGTVSKFAGDQDGLTGIDAFYENTGATIVNSGTLLFRLGGTHSGSFDVAEEATLWLTSPGGFSQTLAPGSSVAGAGRILLGGTIEIADGANYAFSGTTELCQRAHVFLNATNASTHELLLATAHPELRGTGMLTVTGPFNWECGFIGGGAEGPVTVIAADTLAMFGAGTKNIDGHLEIRGSATWTGRGSMLATERAIITIAPKASFSIETDANLDAGGSAIPIINNEGTVTKIIGVDDEIADNRTDVYARYNNTGNTSVLSGMLVLQAGGSHTGPFHVAADATLGLGRLGGGVLGDGHHFQSGSSLIADGNVVLGLARIDPGVPYAVAGTTAISGPAQVLFNDANSTTFALDHSGGNLAGTGKLTVNGPAVWSGGWIGREKEGPITVVMNDSLSIETGLQKFVDGILEIRGDATMNDDLWTTGRGVIKTTPTGTFAIHSDHDFHAADFPFVLGGVFENAGTLTKVVGAADGITNMEMVFQNTGTVRIDSGTLHFGDVFTQTSGATILNGGTLRVGLGLELLGGTLTGSGTIFGIVHNAAVVSPGLSIGHLDLVGDYTQTSNGVLNVEIGGSLLCDAMDELTITGHAALAGTLEINLIDECEPVLGQSFTIMSYASHDGVFDSVNNRCAGAGLMFAVNYTDLSVALEVVEQPAPNGDLDFNDRVDLRDVALFQRCFTGADGSSAPCCEQADLNLDTSIDLADLESFISLIAGP